VKKEKANQTAKLLPQISSLIDDFAKKHHLTPRQKQRLEEYYLQEQTRRTNPELQKIQREIERLNNMTKIEKEKLPSHSLAKAL
jgi:polyhydroxyalkanoate synthesis regulator phasin